MISKRRHQKRAGRQHEGAEELNKSLEELRRELLEKEELSWQDKKRLEELLAKQKELEKKLDQMAADNQQKTNSKTNSARPTRGCKKQQQLQELMDQIMSEEMRGCTRSFRK